MTAGLMEIHRDPQVNLLPWRERQRRDRKMVFLWLLGGLMLLAAIATGLRLLHLTALMDIQQTRNRFIEEETAARRAQNAAGELAKQQRNELLARMQVIQQLQAERLTVARIFQELPVRLEDGVFLTRLSREGRQLEITGIAESSSRIPAQLRRLAESPLFTSPNVVAISSAPELGEGASGFHFSLQQAKEAPAK